MQNFSTPICCIGDSHVSFFSGENRLQPNWPKPASNLIPLFQVFRIGAALAYNLCEYGTKMRSKEVLSVLLERQAQPPIIPPKSTLLFCFGEIDCRAHILKRQSIDNSELTSIVNDVVERYFSVLEHYYQMGYSIIVWNVVPTSRNESKNPEYPAIGTCEERNNVTRLFNSRLSELCDEKGLLFLDIFNQLLLPDGLQDMKYYMDDVHLSQAAMPIVLKELNHLLGNTVVPKWMLSEHFFILNKIYRRYLMITKK